ncbi:MAG: long-chain-fatty-acid--CoA ligase [Planctomycetota bacterium]|nr:long-chain-fatty-acid--CoA ligase [Planctomycetota bacterium]
MSEQIDSEAAPLAGHVVAEIPRLHAGLRPDASALVMGGRARTFAELDRRSSAIAQGLIAAGLGPGARVALFAEDSLETFELIFGIAKAGCVFTGINPRLVGPEVRYILEDGEVEALFLDGPRAERLLADEALLEGLRLVVELGRGPAGGEAPVDFDDWVGQQVDADPLLEAGPEDVFAQLYTSGTTGRPKGVRLANRSFFGVVASMRAAGDDWIGWSAEDVTLFNIPSFHIGGLWWALTALGAGATGVVMPSFRPPEVHTLVPRHRITKVCMVPAMIQLTLDEPGAEAVDWSSLAHLVYGGAPIPKVLQERSRAVFGCDLVQIYGLTETGNTAVCLRAEDHLEDRLLLAAGRAYPGVQLKVLDRAGQALPPGEVGEVCILSPANMVGYWKLPEATAATLVDGWVHTGDAGYLDQRGYLFLRDRIKDMIISAGENIYPAELEGVLAACPGVREAAVIGVPDDRWGERVLALVVRTPDQTGEALRKRALFAHCRAHLADFKVPSAVEFVDGLPRTPSGKLKKAELRAPYWAGRDRQV